MCYTGMYLEAADKYLKYDCVQATVSDPHWPECLNLDWKWT